MTILDNEPPQPPDQTPAPSAADPAVASPGALQLLDYHRPDPRGRNEMLRSVLGGMGAIVAGALTLIIVAVSVPIYPIVLFLPFIPAVVVFGFCIYTLVNSVGVSQAFKGLGLGFLLLLLIGFAAVAFFRQIIR
jgi:hypothetical protein